MGHVLTIGGKLSVLICATAATVALAAERPKVLIVHDDEAPMRRLADGLRDHHGLNPALVHQNEWRDQSLEDFRAVVMYIHKPIEAKIEDALIGYGQRGGRLVILHHGIASAKNNNPRWLEFLGIAIPPRDHPQHPWNVLRGTFQLVCLEPEHFVTRNGIRYPVKVPYSSETFREVRMLPALELPKTEIFLNQLFTGSRERTVLFGFRTEIDGKTYMQDRGGWFMRAGRGLVFYFQPGHFADDFTGEYVQIIANAILWDGQ
jgi:type 1 glutamine amidotransferase